MYLYIILLINSIYISTYKLYICLFFTAVRHFMAATVAPRMNEGNQITVYKCAIDRAGFPLGSDHQNCYSGYQNQWDSGWDQAIRGGLNH